jgi:predicted dehydrogenase
LAGQFHAKEHCNYDEYGECLKNPQVEAVYIATPPGEHEKYAVLAARAKRHVLCEKPLAATVEECRRMVRACRDNTVQFMTGYRKYFEPGSAALKKIISSGDLGRVDIIHTAFTEFRPAGDGSPDWLFKRKLGGGPLMDIGVYCVNTSRWLVDEDPVQAAAIRWCRDRERFKEIEEGMAFRLNFRSGLVLQGTASWGSVLASFVHVHGEKGWASLCPAFAFEEERRLTGKIAGKWFEKELKPSTNLRPSWMPLPIAFGKAISRAGRRQNAGHSHNRCYLSRREARPAPSGIRKGVTSFRRWRTMVRWSRPATGKLRCMLSVN